MKRPSKMINARSSSKTRQAAAAADHSKAEKLITHKVKFASLHEEEEEADDGADAAAAHNRLRQNPKKTFGVSTSKTADQQRFVCSKCGKAFQSSKAMCGHMACHSEKEKPSSNVVAKKKLVVMDSESDTDQSAGAGQMRRRSRRTRYKKHDYVAADSKAAKLDVVNNCSSEASGIEQEQEEVAICLMMLSRDSSNWGGLNSIGDLSDNNSVVLEDRSISTRLGNKNCLSSGYDLNEVKDKYRRKKIESLRDFDSGEVRNGVNNAESDARFRSLRKNKFDEDSKCEPHLSLKKLRSIMDGEGYSQIQKPKTASCTGKGTANLNESYNAGMCKRVEHKALVRSQSHQPLDVNAASNKQFTAAYPYERSHNSFETDDAHHNMRKGKGILDDNSGNVGGGDWKKGKYECPVFSKDFGSAHELGCQRRVHLAEGSEDVKCDEVQANFKRNGFPSHDFIDLNLPAPMEDEEANESMGSY